MWIALGASVPIAALSALLAPHPLSSLGILLAIVVCVFVAWRVSEGA
jgi:uncharacterized membrane protein